MALTARQQRFVDEYLIDLNATQAAIRAGYSAKTALQQGPRLLGNVGVSLAIQNGKKERSDRVQVDQDWVLRRYVEIASADPRELVEYRRGRCEACWGTDGALHALDDVDPQCPACHGEGRGRVLLADTRTLSPGAARLYAGVQIGKDGIKVNMRDQDAALTNIARHLGMFPGRVELTGKGGGPIEYRKVQDLSDDELLNIARGGGEGAADPAPSKS